MRFNMAIRSAVLLSAFLVARPGAAVQEPSAAATSLAVGCSTCFPKPPGIQDAFDQAELDAASKEGQALVVLAHDAELTDAAVYERALVIEERFPVYGSLSRTGVLKSQLETAVAGRNLAGPELGTLRVYAAGTPVERQKLRNLLRKLEATRSIQSGPPVFLSQDADLERLRSDPDALVVVFHAPAVQGFKRLPIDGIRADDEAPQGAYVLQSRVTVYRQRSEKGAKAYELLLGMLDRR